MVFCSSYVCNFPKLFLILSIILSILLFFLFMFIAFRSSSGKTLLFFLKISQSSSFCSNNFSCSFCKSCNCLKLHSPQLPSPHNIDIISSLYFSTASSNFFCFKFDGAFCCSFGSAFSGNISLSSSLVDNRASISALMLSSFCFVSLISKTLFFFSPFIKIHNDFTFF